VYRHLLVPLDGSRLAGDTIEQALAYARDVGARVSFLHAQPDFAATTDGVLMHAINAQWRHMSAEETLVLPAASLHLSLEDWATIERAFHDNQDPRFGEESDQSFAELASKLLNLAAGG